jgi:flagellin-like protein
MKRIWKGKKALSPVVAAIILIAVTVAVSIAVAAWMGALTFTFMSTEELTFTGRTWDTAATYIDIKIKNSGTAALTIDKVEVNDEVLATGEWNVAIPAGATTTLDAGDEITVQITPTAGFESGTKYAFVFVTAKGNRFGPYSAIAP